MDESTVSLLEQLDFVQRILQSQRLTRHANVARRVREVIATQEQTISHLKELVEALQSEDVENVRYTTTDSLEVDLDDTDDFDRPSDLDDPY